jgi:hypothetical protein
VISLILLVVTIMIAVFLGSVLTPLDIILLLFWKGCSFSSSAEPDDPKCKTED